MKIKLARLDKTLVDRKLCDSRTTAQQFIEEGRVKVNGQTRTKPASMVSESARIEVDAPSRQWVSRGAHKLLKALDFFEIDPSGKICIDIGASTGGFTDVLLSRGAARVYSVDVGYGQLAWKLRNDARVVVLERTNARYLTLDMLGTQKADIIVSDASFISLKLLIGPLEKLLKDEGKMVLLVKPQFEVGKERVGKGVVSDPSLHLEVLEELFSFIYESTGLAVRGATYSPIRGPEGNIEFLFLLGAKKDGGNMIEAPIFAAVVKEAHENT